MEYIEDKEHAILDCPACKHQIYYNETTDEIYDYGFYENPNIKD